MLPGTSSGTDILTSSTHIYTHYGTNIRPGVYVGWVPANSWNRIRYAPSVACICVSSGNMVHRQGGDYVILQ